MNNVINLEDAIYVSCQKAVQDIVLEQIATKKELIAFVAREALDDDNLKKWVKDFINYDEGFRGKIEEVCLEALQDRLDKIVSGIKEPA